MSNAGQKQKELATNLHVVCDPEAEHDVQQSSDGPGAARRRVEDAFMCN